MRAIIEPGFARGEAAAPPSKSMAHRSLICGALSENSTVDGLAFSEDIRATSECLRTLGASVRISGTTAQIGGLDPLTAHPSGIADCGESGSTLRFLLPLCLCGSVPFSMTGRGRLPERPMTVYEDICKKEGLMFERENAVIRICGPLHGGVYEVPGDISSQFISGLLFALPLLPEDSLLCVKGKTESASYIGLTLKALSDFGIRIERPDAKTYRIPGRQRYASRRVTVEGDYSNAAFLDAFNLLGGSVTVTGLDGGSLQGDRVYRQLYDRLEKESTPVIDLSDCPDLAPVLFSLAAAKNGAVFDNTARLRLKESDRAAAMKEELMKFGIPVTVEENRVTVHPAVLKKPTRVLDGHNDHRIVMALSLLCTLTGGCIEGAEAVAKSYPDFFRVIEKLGIKVKTE